MPSTTPIFTAAAVLFLTSLTALAAAQYPRDSSLRLEHISLRRTHNSYHIANALSTLPPVGGAQSLRYTHAPLEAQLARGVRGFEFDVFETRGRVDGSLAVFHDPSDAGTHCTNVRDCLAPLVQWSAQHAGQHAPIAVMFEFKSDTLTALHTLEEEVLAVLNASEIVTPPQVQGGHATLRDAVRAQGWPTLGDVRGRFLFMVQTDKDLEVSNQTDWALAFEAQQTLFALGREESANVTSCVIVDPNLDDFIAKTGSYDGLIADRVLLRVRADADLKFDRVDRREAALANGAHFVDTDVPFINDYSPEDAVVLFPDGTPGICNPVSAPAACDPADVETGITSLEDTKKPSPDYWCCQADAFVVPVVLIVGAGFLAVTVMFGILRCRVGNGCCCCDWKLGAAYRTAAKESAEAPLNWLRWASLAFVVRQVGSAIAVVGVRSFTDALILRHDVPADDLITSIGAALGGVADGFIAYATWKLWRWSSTSGALLSIRSLLVLQRALVAPAVWIAAFGESADGGKEQTLGYGNVDTDKAFASLLLVDSASAFLALVGVFLLAGDEHEDGKEDTILPMMRIAALAILFSTPQLLIVAYAGDSDDRVPDTLAPAPQRVVLWHNLFLTISTVVFSIVILNRRSVYPRAETDESLPMTRFESSM